MMPNFDVYAFADYSGATSLQQQRKHIVLATLQAVRGNADTQRPGIAGVVGAMAASVGKAQHVEVFARKRQDEFASGKRQDEVEQLRAIACESLTTTAHTRESLLVAVQELLLASTLEQKRVILGFDHSYSFPVGFYETVTGQHWERWEQLLQLLVEGVEELPGIAGLPPRTWAELANHLIGHRLQITTGGPFWGSHFSQLRDPKFPYAETLLQERRLVEERCRRMKPIYKIGGAGAVGLQSLYGITYMASLKEYCRTQGLPLFCWPFDGWEVPETGHLLVEIYPTLYNQGERTDAEDARSCALWLAKEDRTGTLGEWFHPVLSAVERQRVQVEGWVLGVN